MEILNKTNIALDLADIIETYLLNQGRQTMEDCIKSNSKYVRLSANINNLGWDCFVEGHCDQTHVCWYKPRGTKFIKSLISLTHKQWLHRSCDVHYISNGLTSRQQDELASKIKELMKTKRTALLGQHWHCMNTNFKTLRHGPTVACQVWVANMEMAISIAKFAEDNFCTQEILRQLYTPLTLPTIQHTRIMTLINVRNTSPNPPPIYHALVITPRARTCHASSSKTPYSKPRTNHRLLTPPRYPTLFPILLRCNNTSKSKSPHQFFPLFHLAVAPQPYDKISAHLHHLHVWKKASPLHPGLAWTDSIFLWLH